MEDLFPKRAEYRDYDRSRRKDVTSKQARGQHPVATLCCAADIDAVGRTVDMAGNQKRPGNYLESGARHTEPFTGGLIKYSLRRFAPRSFAFGTFDQSTLDQAGKILDGRKAFFRSGSASAADAARRSQVAIATARQGGQRQRTGGAHRGSDEKHEPSDSPGRAAPAHGAHQPPATGLEKHSPVPGGSVRDARNGPRRGGKAARYLFARPPGSQCPRR